MKRWSLPSVILVLMCQMVVTPQSLPQKVTGDVTVLQAYEGSWKLVIDNVATKYSTVSHEEKYLRNDCWHSGSYYACNQYVDGDSKLLLVFTFDATKQIYTSYQVPLDGSAASSGTLEIRDNTWTYPWVIVDGGHAIYFHVVNVFKSPTEIEYRREFSFDRVNWVVMARGKETKTK
ncbi:hypothetical protein [Tunturiibacter psychrotolerans]|uniref:hypothetical protein n=1 Tax=Tunturiibacter psychrotolerans TaxID=3069686 RepID=UPI003D1B21C6